MLMIKYLKMMEREMEIYFIFQYEYFNPITEVSKVGGIGEFFGKLQEVLQFYRLLREILDFFNGRHFWNIKMIV